MHTASIWKMLSFKQGVKVRQLTAIVTYTGRRLMSSDINSVNNFIFINLLMFSQNIILTQIIKI